jgi:hypothetical protein
MKRALLAVCRVAEQVAAPDPGKDDLDGRVRSNELLQTYSSFGCPDQ